MKRPSYADYPSSTSILAETIIGRASIKNKDQSTSSPNSSMIIGDEEEEEEQKRYEIASRKKSARMEKLENTLESEVERRRTIHEIDLRVDLVDELISSCLPYDIKEDEFNLSDDIQYYSQDPSVNPFDMESPFGEEEDKIEEGEGDGGIFSPEIRGINENDVTNVIHKVFDFKTIMSPISEYMDVYLTNHSSQTLSRGL